VNGSSRLEIFCRQEGGLASKHKMLVVLVGRMLWWQKQVKHVRSSSWNRQLPTYAVVEVRSDVRSLTRNSSRSVQHLPSSSRATESAKRSPSVCNAFTHVHAFAAASTRKAGKRCTKSKARDFVFRLFHPPPKKKSPRNMTKMFLSDLVAPFAGGSRHRQ